MTISNDLLFKGLKIIAWIIFVSLCVESGGLIVNFFFSIYKPEMVEKLYNKLDLSALYHQNRWAFYQVYSFIVTISILKAYLFYLVVLLVTKLNLEKPFDNFVSKQIMQISYFTFSIGILSYLARQNTKTVEIKNFTFDNIHQYYGDAQAFVLMAAVIYIIAIIFKKGVEIQNENDLTV